ncbi:MAG: aspartate kinase [Christensenellales bacterium]
MTGIRVAKFGGSSLADAKQFEKVIRIIQSDQRRRFVVPSAPGKRHSNDDKITDLLLHLHTMHQSGQPCDDLFWLISSRYTGIVKELQLDYAIQPELDTIYKNLKAGYSSDYIASRGEYLNGLILSKCLGFPFLDPQETIFFEANGIYDAQKTQQVLSARLSSLGRAVVPGFYGSLPDGNIKTFPRGGSDVTGAIVARAANADIYENWTDVPGFMMADPKIIRNPKIIDVITYRELRELSYMGASVLHEDSVFPVREAGIPINVRNTNDPQQPGTMIVSTSSSVREKVPITGIAGRKGFTVITIEKDMMNAALGFCRRALSVFESYGISFEHLPSGIDTISIVVSEAQIRNKLEMILEQLRKELNPDIIDVQQGMALVAVVGHGMRETIGIAAHIFTALAQQGINIRMIDQGSSEMNIIIGVEDSQFENSIKAIYNAFIKEAK